MSLIYAKKEYQLISVDSFLQKKIEYNCPPIKCGLCLVTFSQRGQYGMESQEVIIQWRSVQHRA